MKIKISDTLIIDSESILSAELEETTITFLFSNKHEIREFYNNEMEALCVFNNISNHLPVTDVRFYHEPINKEEDERKAKGFEMFWNLYDKKVDISRCRKSFMNLSLEDMVEAVKGVKKYVDSTPDKKYRKNPSTWINQKGWTNEILTDKKKTNRYIKPKYVTDER